MKGLCELRQAAFFEEPLEGSEGTDLLGWVEGFAEENEARGLIGDG